MVVWWFFALFIFLFLGKNALALSAADLKENLRQQINTIQEQIDAYRNNIKELQRQGKTLKGEISILDAKIKSLELGIRQLDLSVRQIENEISSKNVGIGQAELKLAREKELIVKYFQAMAEADDRGFLEILLKNEKLSAIFDEINSLQEVRENIQASMIAMRQLKTDLENEKQSLEDERDELNQLKVLQEIQRRTLVLQQSERKNLLTQTKGQESNYQKLLDKAKADAASIRKNLYLLEGVGVAMPLEQAYCYAKRAGDLTGVRPAFLLAVLKKESSWGERVGTGAWRKDMHSRDQKAFIEICDKLGLDPDKTPVSRKPSYGWGGAMGPAQFLPSVWLAYEEQIANLTGHRPPDPWSIEDAFAAAGLKLAQNGATAGNEGSEWKAAQIYFAGKRWNNPAYYFYGDQVMELTSVIQEQLNMIGG